MSAFVLPAELPAHKISCCVYCSLNKSPHLFSTISTTYHYSTIVYFTHCYVGLLVLTILCRCIFFVFFILSFIYHKHYTCLYCIVSFQWVQWTTILSISFLFWVLIVHVNIVFIQEMFYWELSWTKFNVFFLVQMIWIHLLR